MNTWDLLFRGDAVSSGVALVLLAMSVGSWVVILWKSWLLQRVLRDVVEVFQPLHDRSRLGAVDVDLGPVAGRQDRGFLHLRPAQEVAQGVPQRFRLESDLLPHVERGGLVVEA